MTGIKSIINHVKLGKNDVLYKNKEWLKNQYSILEKSAREIAKNHPGWKGIIGYTYDGYKTVWCPSHPRSNHNRVLFHFLVMEEYLERYLKSNELIHHIDGNKKNNNINNLFLCKNPSEHYNAHLSCFSIIIKLLKNNKVIFDKKEGIYKLI